MITKARYLSNGPNLRDLPPLAAREPESGSLPLLAAKISARPHRSLLTRTSGHLAADVRQG